MTKTSGTLWTTSAGSPASTVDGTAATVPVEAQPRVGERLSLVRRLREYYELCKPRVVTLILFTVVVGMLLAVPGLPPLSKFVFGFVGIGLEAACAAAINQLIDRRIDARMARTCGRPLVTGRLTVRESVVFAVALGVVGFAVLWTLVNPLTAWLTTATLIGYAGIYTMYLKRATPQNIVIGGAAGAFPPVLGWTAITGHLDPQPLLLCLIIFAWTPPHFWALAIERHREYAAVEVPMLPVTHGLDFTRTQVLLYTLLLLAVTLLPFAIGMSGVPYLVGALALGSGFVVYAARLKWWPRPGLAMGMFAYSIVYLTSLFGLLLADHYLGR